MAITLGFQHFRARRHTWPHDAIPGLTTRASLAMLKNRPP
jgi:hypothetical protein